MGPSLFSAIWTSSRFGRTEVQNPALFSANRTITGGRSRASKSKIPTRSTQISPYAPGNKLTDRSIRHGRLDMTTPYETPLSKGALKIRTP